MNYIRTLSNGFRVGYEAADDVAAALLTEHARWTPLTADDGNPPDAVMALCSVHSLPQYYRIRRVAESRLELQLQSGRADWQTTERIVLHRLLDFLPLLPLLLKGATGLAHGATAAFQGRGLAFCGPSGVGKSTAVGRLPPTWEVGGDDVFLLFRHGDGYRTEALTTWSLFGKPLPPTLTAADWRTPRCFALERFCLLTRGAVDARAPLPVARRILKLQPCLNFFNPITLALATPAERRQLLGHHFNLCHALCRQLPVEELALSPSGPFWTLLEATPTTPKM